MFINNNIVKTQINKDTTTKIQQLNKNLIIIISDCHIQMYINYHSEFQIFIWRIFPNKIGNYILCFIYYSKNFALYYYNLKKIL